MFSSTSVINYKRTKIRNYSSKIFKFEMMGIRNRVYLTINQFHSCKMTEVYLQNNQCSPSSHKTTDDPRTLWSKMSYITIIITAILFTFCCIYGCVENFQNSLLESKYKCTLCAHDILSRICKLFESLPCSHCLVQFH